MGSEETRTDAGRNGPSETGKVVRIPRDWFGPKDDLVPFGPRAAEDWDGDGISSSDGPAAPLDASHFWGEEAGSVQGVVDTNAGPSGARRRRPERAIAVAALIALMAAGGLAASLLAPSGGPARRHLAAVTEHPQLAARLHPSARVEAEGARRSVTHRARAKSTHRGPRPKPAIQVTYHTGQSQAATSAVYTAPQAPSTSPVSSSTAPAPARSTAVSTASASRSSQPAFGANGALGPMSSPDG